MRILLRIVMSLVGLVAFFVMLGGGAIWAYGQYGLPLVETQIETLEAQVEDALEDEYPGSTVTVEFEEFYYHLEGTTLEVAFKVHAIAEIGTTEVANETTYTAINVIEAFTGNAEFEAYDESEWTSVAASYKAAPTLLFDAEEAKSTGMTIGIAGAAAFVGSILVKAIFLRRKLA
ncbi:MAG: hypothetical protein WC399_02835 [Bacilli bacterium]